jgi:hypothetical protein
MRYSIPMRVMLYTTSVTLEGFFLLPVPPSSVEFKARSHRGTISPTLCNTTQVEGLVAGRDSE